MINLFNTSAIIGDSLLNTLNAIFMFIDKLLYRGISTAYQVFIAITQINLFSDSTLRIIIDRVFTILGVVMLFIMAYEIILLIINPDKLTGDNGAKKLVTKVITSVIMIVLLPTIYNYMQVFQTNVLTSNIIGNVILGSASSESNYDIKSAGTAMSLSIASAFFHPIYNDVEHSYLSCSDLENIDSTVCQTYIETYDEALKNNDPAGLFTSELEDLLHLNWWEKVTSQERQMRYLPIFSTIAAFFAIKILAAFSMDIGIRVAKLGFLQIIAPIPIAMNIREKESIFSSKWFKSLKETYLTVFMKLITIYFVMFSISMVPEVVSNLWVNNDLGFFNQSIATVAIILGILQFAKDGPALIKELFNMELDFSIKKRLDDNTYAQRGLATVAGAGAIGFSNLASGIRNKDGFFRTAGSTVAGIGGGARRSFKNSSGIDSFGKVGSVVDKARAESDKAKAAWAQRRDESLANDGGNSQGDYVPGFTELHGLGRAGLDGIKDAFKDASKWVVGEVSAEKLEAANKGRDSFKAFIDTLTAGDKQLASMEEGSGKALSSWQSEGKMNPNFMPMLRNQFASEATWREPINDEQRSYYNQRGITAGQQMSDEDFLSHLFQNKRTEVGKAIEADFKSNINKQTLGNFLDNNKARLYQSETDNLMKSLEDSLKVLGKETSDLLLQNAGFATKSLKEVELAFTNMNEDNYKKITSLHTQLKIEAGQQKSSYNKAVQEQGKK